MMSETYTEEQQNQIMDTVNSVVERLLGNTQNGVANAVIAELTKPEEGPAVMYDTPATKNILCRERSVPCGATNIRRLIPEGEVKDWARERCNMIAQVRAVGNTREFFDAKIAAYRRGEG